MPEVTIHIGGRSFEVACQDGEEHFLHSAAKMLDDEAQALAAQIGRLPETRMLLMAGLLLADKTANLGERLSKAEQEIKSLRSELDQKRNVSSEPSEPVIERVEVIPQEVTDYLESLAQQLEDMAANETGRE
jgi:cell division protein ZapA